MGYQERFERVAITGGTGFLGKHVVRALSRCIEHRMPIVLGEKLSIGEIIVPSRKDGWDLTDKYCIEKFYQEYKPDAVIHLAAACGGIGANQKNPGSFFYDNLVMGAHMMHVGKDYCKKYVAFGSVCAYPKFTPVPFKEGDLWNGYPEETNAPYGLAKKMQLVQAQAYREQYGMNAIYLIPVNLYGPEDNFDLETSHVIPAIIRKIAEAQREERGEIELWGDGSPTREFLYVKDCAEAIVTALLIYDGDQPINLGTGEEISIRDLAELIAELMQWEGEIRWDSSRPNGQPARCLDTTKAQELMGWKARTSLREGLAETIRWYRARYLMDEILKFEQDCDNLPR